MDPADLRFPIAAFKAFAIKSRVHFRRGFDDGGYARTFVPVGDVFGGLVIPIVESAVDSLVRGELERLRTCADRRCPRHFADDTKSHTRRWCDMRTCGNRAKAQRRRRRRA